MGEYIVLSVSTGGDIPKGEAQLTIEAKDHNLGEDTKSGFYKGTIEISVRKDRALIVHIFPAQMDSKQYGKTLKSLLGKKFTEHIVSVASDNIGFGGSIVRRHPLPLISDKKVQRIVRRAMSERRLMPQRMADTA